MRRRRWHFCDAPGRLEQTKNALECRGGEEDCGRSEGFWNAPDTRRTARPWKAAEGNGVPGKHVAGGGRPVTLLRSRTAVMTGRPAQGR